MGPQNSLAQPAVVAHLGKGENTPSLYFSGNKNYTHSNYKHCPPTLKQEL